jgi:AGCS family alanine or glycine:cation symporter
MTFLSAPALGGEGDSRGNTTAELTLDQRIDAFFKPVVAFIGKILFWDPFEAVGIYNPVVFDDNGVPLRDKVSPLIVNGNVGQVEIEVTNGRGRQLVRGDRIIIGDEILVVDKAAKYEIVVKEPLARNYHTETVYYPLLKPIPLVVVWLIMGALFFTIKFRFINLRGFKHALHLLQGRYSKPDDKGEVSHFQALSTALSATVGLGNIAGVAVAVSIGGAGATFWLIVAGLLGMASKFAECTLGVKYRVINSQGHVSGGPMYYLSRALEKNGMRHFGKVLAVVFAILCIGGSFGGGNMFQANQAFTHLSSEFTVLQGNGVLFGVAMAILVGVVIIGGIRSIARVTDKIVPFMCGLYVLFALIIIGIHIANIDEAILAIWDGAFSPDAIKGGIVGVLVTGFQRAAFSNEAGVGSASIAHSASKTDEPVSEGIVALLEPFIDTVVVCTMTALVLVFTGYAQDTQGLEGAVLTSAAFTTVFPWFKYILIVSIFLFAFSTMISWSYYGLKSFTFLFGHSYITRLVYKSLFLIFIVIGSAMQLGAVLDFSDMMILGMAFPNVLGLVLLSGEVSRDLKSYLARVKSGEIKRYK